MEHKFKKQFGQNFLTDTNLLKAIASDGEITKEDEVLEIGAGAGALTKVLNERAKKVVSYEIDTSLESRLLSLGLKNTKFVFADALKEPLEKIEENFEGQYKVVANLPYYITTPLIFKFLTYSRATSLTIMVQKEVAERIIASSGGKDYGVLSVMCQFYAEAKITRRVNRAMFYPVPKVDSAVVRLTKKPLPQGIDAQKFEAFVKKCFSMRRKTLANNLVGYQGYSKAEIENLLAGFDLKIRPENLSLEQFLRLFKKF